MQPPNQPPNQPPVRTIQADPAYAIEMLRAERDGLASCLGRLQLQLSEALELNHALKRDLGQAQAVLVQLTEQAKQQAAGNPGPRKRGRPRKGNGKAETKPAPVGASPPLASPAKG